MKKDKEKRTSKRNIKTFEVDDDVDSMIELAIKSGKTLKEIANVAIRLHGPDILREAALKLRKQADEIDRNIGGGKR